MPIVDKEQKGVFEARCHDVTLFQNHIYINKYIDINISECIESYKYWGPVCGPVCSLCWDA